MRILVDIGHAKNAHIMGKLAPVLRTSGHDPHFVYRERERLGELCGALGLNGESRGRGADGWLGKILYLIKADHQLLKLSKELKPDLLLSFGSPYLAHVARICRIPMVVFDDTEDNRLVQRIYSEAASAIVVPACFSKQLSDKQSRFAGYFELAYLHPNRFIPETSIRNELGLEEADKLVLLRTVAWRALHDLKHRGLGGEELRQVVAELSRLARVFISAEGELPSDLESLRLNIAPERIHHVMAGAALVFSEGATMAAEAAVLGVPTVHCSDLRPGYIQDLEKRHGLLRTYLHKDFRTAIAAGKEFLREGETQRQVLLKRKESMLKMSVDVVEFMADIIDKHK